MMLLGTDCMRLLILLNAGFFAAQWTCVNIRWKWVVFGRWIENVM